MDLHTILTREWRAMLSNKTVAVVVPAYNEEKLLGH